MNFLIILSLFILASTSHVSASSTEIFQEKYSFEIPKINTNHQNFEFSNFNQDGSRVLVKGDIKYLIDFSLGNIIQRFTGEEVNFSPDGTLISLASMFSNKIKILNAKDGSVFTEIPMKVESNGGKFAAISKTNESLLVLYKMRAMIYDLKNRNLVVDVAYGGNFSEPGNYEMAGLSPDGTKLYIISPNPKSIYDHNVKIFNTTNGVEISSIAVSISPDDFYRYIRVNFLNNSDLVLIKTGKTGNVWSIKDNNPTKICSINAPIILPSNDLKTLLTQDFSNGSHLVVRNSNNCNVLTTIPIARSYISYVTRRASNDDSLVMFNQYSDTYPSREIFNIYNIKTGAHVFSLKFEHFSAGSTFVISPDNKLLIASLRDIDKVKVFSLETGLEVQDLTSLTKNIADFTFSPDGKFIISEGTNNKRIVLERMY